MVGFVWCFALKYPASIYNLFLRRCLPKDATHIAVTARVKRIDILYEKKQITNMFGVIQKSFCRAMNFLFSLESTQTSEGLECRTTYCKVISGMFVILWLCYTSFWSSDHFHWWKDPRTSTRFFYYRMRRYVYGENIINNLAGAVNLILIKCECMPIIYRWQVEEVSPWVSAIMVLVVLYSWHLF